MAKVIKLPVRPKSYTAPERLIESVRQQMFGTKQPNKILAEKCGVSVSTIGNLMSGKTRWPRPTTLGPLLEALGIDMQLVDRKTGKRIDD